ncbi:MAG: DUF547 domain-containing protein [Verrucomicrobiales bacterium]|nr:DUF547 domain-containing protein [Verrucomicrobiales bacterium]
MRDGRVHYAELKAHPASLDRYLDRIAAIPQEDFKRWPRAEQLALLLNLYNAQTVRLILTHYPIASIRRIGLLPGAAWREKCVRLGDQHLSLDDLEHELIRKNYVEPRIHFALVCAAQGCPPLRAEAYEAVRLDAQLADQARLFLSDPAKNRFDPATGTLWLSPIFDWFTRDFAADRAGLREFVTPLLPEPVRRQLSQHPSVRIQFTDYDWSLNDRPAP